MKDGKYEVGDVIAFRVKSEHVGAVRDVSASPCLYVWERDRITIEQGGGQACHLHDFVLERIPNPQLMEGEWWKGWTWKRAYCGYEMKDGEVYLMWSGRISEENGLSPRGIRYEDELASRVCKGDCIVLVPPKQSLCPELKAKIERVEAELAELKKQALG